jgi:hypothetical protein
MLSTAQQIERIITSLEDRGPAAAPVAEALDLARSKPKAVIDLAVATMRRFPKGGTFLNDTLSYLPSAEWPRLVEIALEVFERSAHDNNAAESIVAYASFQALSALHPHLCRIFLHRPNANSYYETCPWRESGEQHLDYLQDVIERRSSSDESRKRAWVAMLQTRDTRAVELAISFSGTIASAINSSSPSDWILANLHLVGFHTENNTLRRSCSDTVYHLRFSGTFFDGQTRPVWLERVHPTWCLDTFSTGIQFGGNANGFCSLCGGTLHRLVTLDPVPPSLPVSGLPRLDLATCLSCLGWERQQSFYRHDENGNPANIAYDGPAISPQFPVGALKSGEVNLTMTPHRWYWQDWGLSNSRQNLNRIGGEPCWIQDVEYPTCPLCGKLMQFLIQLDSDLPTEKGGEWLWGSGGICYGFWCNECRTSGFLWQCT